MERLLLAVVLIGVAVAIAVTISRRREATRGPAAGSGSGSGGGQAGEPTFSVPSALDRSLFDDPQRAWLVVAFTSLTCSTCASVVERMGPLESDQVAVQEVEVTRRRDLHERYGVDAVPLVVVADAEGLVRAHAFGPQTTAGLWSMVAGAREG